MIPSEYGNTLAETNSRLQEMLAAFNNDEYSVAANRANEIGALYFPDNPIDASHVANLVKMTSSAMYFGGIQHQLNENEKEREKKFQSGF